MQKHKAQEFLSVLIVALVVGTGGWLIVTFMSGIAFYAAIGLLTAGTVTLLRMLRKRFGRH